ncbi:unnamed protein product [Mytilus coruscus]|uniref:Endonuclease/exonuclease/phosphatase domain-containing protein n=1 Tax=Mytilus coruscus TaxID=42192 RepID=A0A6J8AZ56_MYTCO|nr:unnamed protein product [Mytilus coruscus]
MPGQSTKRKNVSLLSDSESKKPTKKKTKKKNKHSNVNTGLTIANGRLGNDSCGSYTFCTSRQSVNDYLLVCSENYYIIKNFGVVDFTEFSDHAPLSYEICLNNNIQCNSLPSTHKYLKWDSSKNQYYIQLLSQHNELLISLVGNMNSADDVNNAPTDANRQRYILARNRYNRTKRLAVTNFKRAKGQELCEFAKSDPRKFWSAFKPMNKIKCLADSDLLINHFEQLLGGNPPDICEEVINLIETNSFLNDIVIDSLDTEISEDEILQSINKLKKRKK